ncbi:hypothetical protein ACFSO7_02420 [Bacillus sp. CGMCC 1.16607]|uniref:hypothetical protein n=1 Tax=Bacillus sp. CGMCC 1.16607 TaxID=3351842 RepID=UPI003640C99A
MKDFIEKIQDSSASEVFWILIGIVIGKLLDFFIVFLKGKVKKYRFNKELVGKSLLSVGDVQIVSLDHADPTYELHDILVEQTDKKLFIDCPSEYKERIQLLDPDFHFSANTSFNRETTFEDLKAMTNIDLLPQLIVKHSKLVSESIIRKLEEKNTIFNGKKYGVYRVHRKRKTDHDENASLRLDLFETDYFTHLVFRSIYKELQESNHPISKLEKIEELYSYAPFTTSFGMNTFVILSTPNGEEIVFAKRSKFLKEGSTKSLWHVTMNEGLTLTDREGSDISLIKCLHRGLREELGIREEHHRFINDERFMDLFIEMSNFELGLTSYVKMELEMDKINELYSIAKDGELETDGLITIPIKNNAIKEFLENENLTDAAKYTLKMYLARRKYIN